MGVELGIDLGLRTFSKRISYALTEPFYGRKDEVTVSCAIHTKKQCRRKSGCGGCEDAIHDHTKCREYFKDKGLIRVGTITDFTEVKGTEEVMTTTGIHPEAGNEAFMSHSVQRMVTVGRRREKVDRYRL